MITNEIQAEKVNARMYCWKALTSSRQLTSYLGSSCGDALYQLLVFVSGKHSTLGSLS